ncbi:hypothetical protein B0H13DRAFT_2374478 [Mycena leptocephala]|nr:hypothetical protein B0H13DRAFT_2374478 [Mycena leptocephala]
MKTESVLPVHRPERQLAFNSKVDRAGSSNRFPLVGRVKDSAVGGFVYKLWRVCTTTLEGSLSDTFKLVSSDDSDEARTSASGVSKLAAKVGDADSFLDAVVVDNEDHVEVKGPGLHQSDSSQRSGQGGSNSTGLGMHRLDFHGDDGHHYQGGLKSWIIYRGWPEVVAFFEPRLPEHEEEFQRQTWHSNKLLAFAASLFLILNWVLYLILNNDSTKLSGYGRIVYWAGFTVFTVPTPFMIALDMPRRLPITFQIFFCISVWYCAFSELIQIKQCHFFLPDFRNCHGKDFLAMSYYATGFPALFMFVVSKRLYNCIAQVLFLILLCVLILPDQGIYARNVVSFAVFSIFIQGLDYMMENARRKMFLLALQLKQAFRAKHKAKLAESKASFTKRRFANYIFHEVRVPLNNAVLAFQLLQSGNAFREDYAKTISLAPFDTRHPGSSGGTTGARQLTLDRALDERIDSVPLSLEPGRPAEPEGLWVIGSELRLHQVLTNLATNAVKYTPEGGGSIRISTEFLGITMRDELPGNPPDIEQEQPHERSMEKTDHTGTRVGEASELHQSAHRSHSPLLTRNGSGSVQQTQCLSFRLEAFQPFVQTTVGQSSGSGTGLGLAIVKQIVRLSGGRLGVISRRGEGSKFWIELSYPIASAAEIQTARDANTLTSLPRSYGHRNKNSGFISGPLITSTPHAADKLSDATPAFAAAAEAAASSPVSVSRSPMPPRYESNPDSGTARPESPPLPPAAPTTPLGADVSSSDPLLVLVVDDDAVTRVLSSNSGVSCTPPRTEGVRRHGVGADPHTYDLICLDNFMPVMTGEDAVKEIRANDRDDFVVGCTGNALTEDQDSYREAGADEVMVKPVMIQCVSSSSSTCAEPGIDAKDEREQPQRHDTPRPSWAPFPTIPSRVTTPYTPPTPI